MRSNFVGRVLIAPRQNTGQTKTHIYSTFFVSRLLVEGAKRRVYNFEAVRNDDSRIERGLGSLNELCIPIHVNNVHWRFIRVAMTNNTIQLFDSQGTNTENTKYLQATENYMYEALMKDQRDGRHSFC